MRYCAFTSKGSITLEWCLYLHSGVGSDAVTKMAKTVSSIAADDVKETLNESGIAHGVPSKPRVNSLGADGIIISMNVTLTMPIKPDLMNIFIDKGFIKMETDQLPTV